MLTQTPPRYKPKAKSLEEAFMRRADLKVKITQAKSTVTMALVGEARFDFDAAEEYINEILSLEPKTVIIDASKLTFISSVGMCFWINLRRAIKSQGGAIKLMGLQPRVQEVLHHAHVLHLFEIPASETPSEK